MTANNKLADLLVALKSHQQADLDGVMVEVSRQALDEAIALLEGQPAMPADAARIYTYADQPTDNVTPWRLGEACHKAAKAPGGDYIDGGLSLLKELQAKGYGVVAIYARRRIEGES